MLYLTRRTCKVASNMGGESATKGTQCTWIGYQLHGAKDLVTEPKAARMFATEQRSDGFLVVVCWWQSGEQFSRPVSGPYDTEQEAERRAVELTERESAKPKAITETEGDDHES